MNRNKHKSLLFLVLIFSFFFSSAREGMWIPILLDQHIAEMSEMGFSLTPDDIYSVNQGSMKDAIVQFGGGCTGELISPEGLLLTNHHCGYRQIQQHSSLEKNYLADGFWAISREEELPNPGLTVTFLIRMEEVTTRVLSGTDTLTSRASIENQKQTNIFQIVEEAEKDTHYDATVKPFFEGNQYFLLVTETFRDVRLVGAPPSSIGKFGGDTDNWMWPRHTGDFSLFRIYAGKDNLPSDYSTDNVPYQPRYFFPIRISGVNEGDFTMVFGYPGNTGQYLPSHELKLIIEQVNPAKIAVRDLKISILQNAMQGDEGTRIKYAARYASTSNAWKKWKGELLGLRQHDAVSKKEQKEKSFSEWVQSDSMRNTKYGTILPVFDSLYPLLLPYQQVYDLYTEACYRGADVYRMVEWVASLRDGPGSRARADWLVKMNSYFNDYSYEVDRELFVRLTLHFTQNVPDRFQPEGLKKMVQSGQPEKQLGLLYDRSLLGKKELLLNLSVKESLLVRRVKNDQLFRFIETFQQHYRNVVLSEYYVARDGIDWNQQRYMAALIEQNSGQLIYPEANFTLRVSYGKVEGYQPRDGVIYNHYTTLDGIMEKENPEIYDYQVPEKLKELHKAGEYGRYAMKSGAMPVCFTASNHTTGGNSGSPVIDAGGNLIGINFDRCWEGTMSDLMYDRDKCRNISLDVRYLLFIIDRFAGAGYLLDEMKIIE